MAREITFFIEGHEFDWPKAICNDGSYWKLLPIDGPECETFGVKGLTEWVRFEINPIPVNHLPPIPQDAVG